MNLLETQFSYQGIFKQVEMRSKEQTHRRVFGKDITNLEKKSKNISIYDKSTSKRDTKIRSKSFNFRKQQQIKKDPVNDYQRDILLFMSNKQSTQKQENQKQISDKMRQILIDWIVDVHQSFGLKQQTLHLCLCYLNQFSHKAQINKQQYQLVGATCLWLASKYQEIYPPKMQNYVDVTDNTYSVQQLKRMEGRIIQVLQFNLNYVTSLQLIQAISHKIPQLSIAFGKYALELALLENLGKRYCPIIQVIASIRLADLIFKTKSDLTILSYSANVSKEKTFLCFKEMCSIIQSGNKYNLKAIKRKFQKEKYHYVAKLKLQHK